jgi:hypothetical protein
LKCETQQKPFSFELFRLVRVGLFVILKNIDGGFDLQPVPEKDITKLRGFLKGINTECRQAADIV